MIAAIICYSIIGLVLGVIFSLLFINFDSSWKKITSSIVGFSGSGGFIVLSSNFFDIKTQSMKFYTVSSFFVMFLISFFLMMIIMCILIKDKDDTDIIRIRDILLGQKSYIDKYYEKREKEIDAKLGIPILEERESKISQKENIIVEKERIIENEQEEIARLGKNKLKIDIPYNHKIVLTKDLLESMPEYIYRLGRFIVDLQINTQYFCDKIHSLNELKSYLYSISAFIMKDIFATNSDRIRIHFRYYNEERNYYDTLTVINGKEIISRKLTPIPYSNSLIEKSYICKRSLIKSLNTDFYYEANNYTVWQDYITYSFYSFSKNNLPLLTFGISVKNKAIHKNIFYFLSYFNLEQHLEEALVKINDNHNIEKIIY